MLIVEEIHKIRKEHAAKFNYNLQVIVEEFQRQQLCNGRTVVSFAEKDKSIAAESQSTRKQSAERVTAIAP